MMMMVPTDGGGSVAIHLVSIDISEALESTDLLLSCSMQLTKWTATMTGATMVVGGRAALYIFLS
jgi:hypothetical protein